MHINYPYGVIIFELGNFIRHSTTIFYIFFMYISLQAISGNTQYQVIPRRIKISKRLAQCMHPALPSGVHLKALETYDVIFGKTGAERLAQELFIYRFEALTLHHTKYYYSFYFFTFQFFLTFHQCRPLPTTRLCGNECASCTIGHL